MITRMGMYNMVPFQWAMVFLLLRGSAGSVAGAGRGAITLTWSLLTTSTRAWSPLSMTRFLSSAGTTSCKASRSRVQDDLHGLYTDHIQNQKGLKYYKRPQGQMHGSGRVKTQKRDRMMILLKSSYILFVLEFTYGTIMVLQAF